MQPSEPDFLAVLIGYSLLGGIKYAKSTVRNQSIIQKSFSSLLHPKWCFMSNQQVLKRVKLNALPRFTACTPKSWSRLVFTPKILE
jgi:hypothetical protein